MFSGLPNAFGGYDETPEMTAGYLKVTNIENEAPACMNINMVTSLCNFCLIIITSCNHYDEAHNFHNKQNLHFNK